MRLETKVDGTIKQITKPNPDTYKRNFVINALIRVSQSKVEIDKKLESRAEEFRAWFGTMYPLCNEYAMLMSKASSYLNNKDNPIMDGQINQQYLMNLMAMSLQIWLAKMIRNQ